MLYCLSYIIRGCGGTGRRAGLRIQCRKAYGFDPLHPHHMICFPTAMQSDFYVKVNFCNKNPPVRAEGGMRRLFILLLRQFLQWTC